MHGTPQTMHIQDDVAQLSIALMASCELFHRIVVEKAKIDDEIDPELLDRESIKVATLRWCRHEAPFQEGCDAGRIDDALAREIVDQACAELRKRTALSRVSMTSSLRPEHFRIPKPVDVDEIRELTLNSNPGHSDSKVDRSGRSLSLVRGGKVIFLFAAVMSGLLWGGSPDLARAEGWPSTTGVAAELGTQLEAVLAPGCLREGGVHRSSPGALDDPTFVTQMAKTHVVGATGKTHGLLGTAASGKTHKELDASVLAKTHAVAQPALAKTHAPGSAMRLAKTHIDRSAVSPTKPHGHSRLHGPRGAPGADVYRALV